MAPQRATFCFTEEFEDATLEAYSCGKGRFTEGTPNADYHVYFGVRKDGISLDIHIYDFQLEQWLRTIAPLKGDKGEFFASTTMDVLLPCYPELKNKFCAEKRGNQSFDALELFMCDFLQEGSIFRIFGFENLHEQDILTELHFHDIQNEHRSMSKDLDRLDDLIDEVDKVNFTDLPHESLIGVALRCELRQAIKKSDSKAVASTLAREHGMIDAKTLCVAVEVYDPSVFQILIDHGCEVDGDDVLAEPLKCAAKAGNLEAVKILLDHGASLEGGKFRISVTPLTGAASGGHLDIVRYLVERGANVDGNLYKSPLCRAIKHLRTDVVRYLWGAGAEFFAADFWTTYSKLSTIDQASVDEVLACQILADLSKHDRGSLLFQAAGYGYLEIVRLLLNHDIEINQQCHWFPLGDRVRYAHPDGNSALAGLRDTYFPDSLPGRCSGASCSTPLSAALSNNHPAVASYLVNHGASLTSIGGRLPQFDATEPDYKAIFFVLDCLFREMKLFKTTEKERFETSYACNPGWIHVLRQFELMQHIHSLPNRFKENTDAVKCLAFTAIRARERQKFGCRLQAKVENSRQKILDARNSHSTSTELAVFADRLGTSSLIWKKGTRAIRNIIHGVLPHDLSDVISSLQVADAMRSAVPPSELVCSEQEFVNDIHRWTVLVKSDEIPLFYEIASCLWTLNPQAMRVDTDSFPDVEALSFLQELVKNLVTESGLFESDYIGSSGTHRLQSLRQRYSSMSQSAPLPGNSATTVGSSVLDDPKAHKIPPIEDPKPPDPEQRLRVVIRVTLLMAGAIFGAVLIFMCLFRGGWKMPSLDISDSATDVDWASNQILIRNCFILAIYLGLPFILGPKDSSKLGQGSANEAGGSAHLQHIPHLWLPDGSDHTMSQHLGTDDISMPDAPTDFSFPLSPDISASLPTSAMSALTSQSNSPTPTPGIRLEDGTLLCPRCESTFKLGRKGKSGQASNLQKHMKNYHPEDVPNYQRKLYKCKHGCGRADPSKSNIQAHEDRHCPTKKGKKPRQNGKWRPQGTETSSG